MKEIKPINKTEHALHVIVIYVILICKMSCADAFASQKPEIELNRLNETIREAPDYRLAKEKNINRLLARTYKSRTPRQLFETYMAIGESYHTFIADSALHYYILAEQQARISGDTNLVHQANIAMIGGMSVAGFFNEAYLRLDSMEKKNLPASQKLDLWMAARQLFASVSTYVGDQTPMSKSYHQRYLAYDDSLLLYLPKGSENYNFIYAERLVSTGQYEEARKLLQKILNSNPESANIYAKASYQLALVYRHIGDEQQYAGYLAKAATSDIKGCVTEGWALPMLAEWLYLNGELDQAFTYINFSLSEAMMGNARMRSSVIAAMVPAIDDAYRRTLTSSRNRLVIYLCLATFLFLITTLLTIILFRQIKRLHVTQRKLTEISRMQELYLGNFVGLCSTYSSKLRSWQKMVMRKLTSGQTDDLLKTLKAGKISDENEDFHSAIDKAFLELYPNFVEEVNALLKPDEQIHLSKSGVLTPELRIYALIRLGVDESARIASILQYSANTVYTYRNKMRNRAIDRASFDNQIRKISYMP